MKPVTARTWQPPPASSNSQRHPARSAGFHRVRPLLLGQYVCASPQLSAVSPRPDRTPYTLQKRKVQLQYSSLHFTPLQTHLKKNTTATLQSFMFHTSPNTPEKENYNCSTALYISHLLHTHLNSRTSPSNCPSSRLKKKKRSFPGNPKNYNKNKTSSATDPNSSQPFVTSVRLPGVPMAFRWQRTMSPRTAPLCTAHRCLE